MSVDEVIQSLRLPVRVAGKPEEVMSLSERMAHHHVPGVSVALLEAGHIAWAEGYGAKTFGETEPIMPETRFQAASISKPVAAACALRLVERGLLALDEDVNLKLTSWQVPEGELTGTEKVTLRRLLSHSAGLTVRGFRGYAAGEAVPTTLQVLSGEAPANSEPVVVDLVPGTQLRYSGGGYTVLQQLIEDVTEQTFTEAVRTHVLEPTGMKHSTYEQPLPEALEPEVATAHTPAGATVPGGWHTYPEQAAAGLWTTPTDLARFALALQASLRGDEGALLSAHTVREMLTAQLGSFGLGLEVKRHGGETWFSHNGANEGYRCALLAVTTGQGVVVMTNGDNGASLARELLAGAAHVYGWQAVQPKVRERTTLDLEPYAGDYRIEDWDDPITLEVDGDVLRARLPGIWQGGWQLVPESETRFFMLEDDLDVLFTLSERGEVEALALGEGGYVAKKEL